MPDPTAPPTTRVRLASVEDFDAVARLEHLDDPAAYRRSIAQHRYFLLERDGRITGLARLDFFWEAVPYLGYIFIEPAARGRGDSRRLLDAVIERARSAGQPRLFSSSEADEPQPQAWHRHVGFRDAGRIEQLNDYDGSDEVFFVLDL